MSGKVERECLYCGKSFSVYPSDVESGGAKFCSRECFANARTSRVYAICQICGREFETFPSSLKRGGGKYCSVACRAKARYAHVERVCGECGQAFMARRGEVEHGGGKYCSNECRARARRKRITFVCAECRKEIEIPQCREGMRFCSFECLQRWREREQHVSRVCVECGRSFEVVARRAEDGKGRFCSKACWKKHFTEKGPAWWYEEHSDAKATMICARCGKEFLAREGSQRRFCSLVCRWLYRGESSIEALIREELERRGVPFEPQAQIGRFCVDFVLPQSQSVIECDGDYWHSQPGAKTRDQLKDHYLAEKGYCVFRFTEAEIRKSPADCVDRVLREV